jgi:hypothetical protein
MPIFEEKLICPLAVRFSQDHIRPEFQNGYDIETVISSINTKPGPEKSGYDAVLLPPFPAIEIIRGHLKSGDADHWLSLDNRRLYCLQRAALALWPQRIAVQVEALRAPTDGMRKKVTSSVDGLSVGIGHSPKALIARWDWQESVKDVSGVTSAQTEEAKGLVDFDDAKACIQDLCDVEAPPSMLDLFFQNEDASTAEPRSPRDSETSTCQETNPWMPNIIGEWSDGKGNTYKLTLATQLSWNCVRKTAAGGRRKFVLWYDESTDCVSWGDDWSYWADASEIRDDFTYVTWYGDRDVAKRKPRFQWSRCGDRDVAVNRKKAEGKSWQTKAMGGKR